MKGLITGALLVITSTYALAAKTEYKFSIKYNVENKKVVSIKSEKNIPENIQQECTERILSNKEEKMFEVIAKGKTGIINLTYICSR